MKPNTKSKKNHIGLDSAKCTAICGELNKLLTNLQVFYMNTRGYHWNIKGDKFFELHIKFEELYNDLALKVDEVAERIVTLGGTPIHAFSDYLKLGHIKEQKNVTDGKKGLQQVVESFGVILEIERSILEMSDEANDEGTNDMMSGYIGEQEKRVWMYTSYLNS